MRPWTPELLAAFPRGASVLPTRPWWTVEGRAITRLDGRVIMLNPSRGNVESPNNAQIARLRTSLEESAQALDAQHPLPHPGYRVGQVWALPNGRAFAVAEVDSLGTAFVLIRGWGPGEPVDTADPRAGKAYPVRLFPLPRKAAFLIADPCCHDRAPWSEPEVAP